MSTRADTEEFLWRMGEDPHTLVVRNFDLPHYDFHNLDPFELFRREGQRRDDITQVVFCPNNDSPKMDAAFLARFRPTLHGDHSTRPALLRNPLPQLEKVFL